MATDGKNGPLALDDGPITESVDNAPKDHDGVPYCRTHHCRMHAKSSAAKSKGKDYYACPVQGCTEKGTRIRTTVEKIVPPSPQACPRCSTDKSPVYCERDKRRSTYSGVVLICPKCQWNAGMFAVPQLEAARLDHRNQVEPIGVGDR